MAMMRKTSIVQEIEILTVQEIRTEVWQMVTLLPELATDDLALQWCARRRLIYNTHYCPVCNRPFTLIRYSQGIDGRRWSCSACRTSKSVRDGSFFSQGRISLRQIVLILYCWSNGMTQPQIQHEVGNTVNSVIDWCKFIREECEHWLENNPSEIGGMDAKGDAIVVEIEAIEYFHRKYQSGDWPEDHWVLGGIERGSGKCFLAEVPDHSSEALEQCIGQYILPGTRIVSDGRAEFANIAYMRDGIYEHSFINTQNIENFWWRAKRKIKRQFSQSRSLMTSHLHAFVYRNKFPRQRLFSNFLVLISDNYI